MQLDTAMKFIGLPSGQTFQSEDTLSIAAHLERFLHPGHYLLVDLKIRFARQVAASEGWRKIQM